MSIKIAISYETDSELAKLMEALSPIGARFKLAEQRGAYRRAYGMIGRQGKKLEGKQCPERKTAGAKMERDRRSSNGKTDAGTAI